MSERNDRLHQSFAGYFNQDWDIGGATSWSEILDEYLSQNIRDDVIRTRDDLRAWLSESDPAQRLPDEFGCDYDPSPDGMTERTWVTIVVSIRLFRPCVNPAVDLDDQSSRVAI